MFLTTHIQLHHLRPGHSHEEGLSHSDFEKRPSKDSSTTPVLTQATL